MKIFITLNDSSILDRIEEEEGIFINREKADFITPPSLGGGQRSIVDGTGVAYFEVMLGAASAISPKYAIELIKLAYKTAKERRKKIKIRIENAKGLSKDEIEMIRGVDKEIFIQEEDEDVSFF